jgi:hypothetical protein
MGEIITFKRPEPRDIKELQRQFNECRMAQPIKRQPAYTMANFGKCYLKGKPRPRPEPRR